MNIISPRRARSQLATDADRMDDSQVERLLEHQQSVEQQVRESGKLSRFSTDIRLMFSMLRDYWSGDYRSVPWKSIAAIAAALLYVLNPLDLIPDFIIGFGLLDDAGVVAACLSMVEADLHAYAGWKAWKEEQQAGSE